MVQAIVSTHIDAPAERVFALYADPANWSRTFPATIRGARVTRAEGADAIVEVEHRLEGMMLNRLRYVSATRVDLEEWKRRCDATFSNEFVPESGGVRYTLRGAVRLKGAYRLLSPLVKPLVRAQLRSYVVEPLRTAAEQEARRGAAAAP